MLNVNIFAGECTTANPHVKSTPFHQIVLDPRYEYVVTPREFANKCFRLDGRLIFTSEVTAIYPMVTGQTPTDGTLFNILTGKIERPNTLLSYVGNFDSSYDRLMGSVLTKIFMDTLKENRALIPNCKRDGSIDINFFIKDVSEFEEYATNLKEFSFIGQTYYVELPSMWCSCNQSCNFYRFVKDPDNLAHIRYIRDMMMRSTASEYLIGLPDGNIDMLVDRIISSTLSVLGLKLDFGMGLGRVDACRAHVKDLLSDYKFIGGDDAIHVYETCMERLEEIIMDC